jgi:1-phosphatidylinositol-4-phosphate 5-kinase
MQDDGGIRGRDANGVPTDLVYYFGIIDILTLYNWRKRGESWFKSLKYNKDDISAVSPKRYARRFIEYMRAGTM